MPGNEANEKRGRERERVDGKLARDPSPYKPSQASDIARSRDGNDIIDENECAGVHGKRTRWLTSTPTTDG